MFGHKTIPRMLERDGTISTPFGWLQLRERAPGCAQIRGLVKCAQSVHKLHQTLSTISSSLKGFHFGRLRVRAPRCWRRLMRRQFYAIDWSKLTRFSPRILATNRSRHLVKFEFSLLLNLEIVGQPIRQPFKLARFALNLIRFKPNE